MASTHWFSLFLFRLNQGESGRDRTIKTGGVANLLKKTYYSLMTSESCSTCSKPMRMSEAMRAQFEKLRSVSPKRMVKDGGRFHDDSIHSDPIDEWEVRFRFESGLCVCEWG